MKRHAAQVVLALAFAASTVSAGVSVWTTNGPTGQQIRALAIDPANPATLYAGTYGGGVFKSTDGGGSWTAVNTGLTSTSVNALAIDPSSTVIVYAGTSWGGVFKSVNGGASWINTGLINAYVQVLAIDPSNPATLYAGTQGSGVYKSTDSGGNWAVANTGLGSPYIFALGVNPEAPATLYAGTEGPQVFKSTDSGSTWSQTGAGPNDPVGYGGCAALVIDPTAPATVYAGTDYGLFKSADGGSSWTVLNSGLPNTSVAALAIDPSEPTTLYAGTWGNGVFKSLNGGASWTPFNNGLTSLSIGALVIDVTGRNLHAGSGDSGVFDYTVTLPASFYTVAPCRVADTRNPVAPSGGPALLANTSRNFPVTGICGIPASAIAVAINVAVFQPTDGGDLRVYPTGGAASMASTINFRPSIVRANNAIAPLGAGGQLAVQCDMPPDSSGSTQFFLDVYGYFQ